MDIMVQFRLFDFQSVLDPDPFVPVVNHAGRRFTIKKIPIYDPLIAQHIAQQR